jgi:hypothetical protein
MQEPHKERVANHLDPKSGADGREAVGEASAGGRKLGRRTETRTQLVAFPAGQVTGSTIQLGQSSESNSYSYDPDG